MTTYKLVYLNLATMKPLGYLGMEEQKSLLERCLLLQIILFYSIFISTVALLFLIKTLKKLFQKTATHLRDKIFKRLFKF